MTSTTSEPRSGRGTDRRFAGRVVVVTGAGSIGEGIGNGRAAAIAYARAGAHLVLVDRNEDSAEETAVEVQACGASCVVVAADVGTEAGTNHYAELAIEAFGGIDVLHNNVGIGPRAGLLELTEARWDLTFRVNVKSLLLGARAVVPSMQQRGGGAIVNISSVASLRYVGTGFAAYSSSKAAANQLVRSLAVELAPDGIRCNTVIVGYVDTPTVLATYREMADPEELSRSRSAAVPLGRSGRPWDVANAALFLASDEAQFVTGTELVVDGGMTNQSG